MRSSRLAAILSPLAALLMFVALASSASAQTDYCRIYRCMTVGTSSFYYCLKCPSCSDAVGYTGAWEDATGACGVCGASNCFAAFAPALRPGGEPAPAPPDTAPPPPAPNRPGAAPHAAPAPAPVRAPLMTASPLTEEPEILYDPEYAKDLRKWIVSIDVTDDGQDNPVSLFLVTAKIKPKKKNASGFHDETSLGFAVKIDVDLPEYPHAKAVITKKEGNHYQFKFKEEDGTEHNKKCTVYLPGP
jgi:hypothetical protein